MKYLAFILNLLWTFIGFLTVIPSIPVNISFSKKELALIFYVKSFWWYSWLPGKKGVRGMVNGHVVLLGPTADEKDLEHELIHVRQAIREPFIHPFLSAYQNWKYGYRQNKYEREAYEKAGNTYVEMTDEQISDYIFIEDEDIRGDIAFVFGTWNAWSDSITKAAELYKQGLVPKVIVSGGVNKSSGQNEGDKMAEELIALGVKKEDVLIENKSTNTLENVLFSLPIIDKEIGLQDIQTITAVVKNYHARRALMTLRKHIPAHIQLKAAVYISEYYDFTKEDWKRSELGKRKVLDEYRKIKTYLAKGDLAEL